jgi:hypothetical protein
LKNACVQWGWLLRAANWSKFRSKSNQVIVFQHMANKLFVWNWQEEGAWYVHVMDCVRDSRGCHGLQHICCGRISCGKAAGKQIKSNSPASWLHLSWFMFGCWGFLSTARMIPCKWLFTCFLPGIGISSLPNGYNSCTIGQKTVMLQKQLQ